VLGVFDVAPADEGDAVGGSFTRVSWFGVVEGGSQALLAPQAERALHGAVGEAEEQRADVRAQCERVP
jgi:hypothetical protein